MDDLHYDLPDALIAQVPPERRGAARLLVLDRSGERLEHRGASDLPELLAPGDLVVVNDTRVIPARLVGHRATGGRVEVFLLEPQGDGTWRAMARSGGRLVEGEAVTLDGGGDVRLVAREPDGLWRVRSVEGDLPSVMAAQGRMPLPPYIHRDDRDPRSTMDRERYQTVYARRPGAVAAPTAGLHLTDEIFARMEGRGIGVARLTLHIGLGTFEPVREERLEDHVMHAERFEVPPETLEAVARTKAKGGRVVAVGTTTVRALEAVADQAARGAPTTGMQSTDLLIAPGHGFRSVDAMLTNFHLPRSTLLALVAAFAGLETVLDAYAIAIERGYRFYSYGDAMLIL